MAADLRFRLWLGFAGLSGMVAVAADALARHHFDPVTDAHSRELLQIATRYQGLHALVLLTVALLAERAGAGRAGRWLAVSGWCFVAGSLLFCGTLYALAFACPWAQPSLTPFGGGAFMLGWLALLAAALAWGR
ncbi:MAG: DUF423 domain-containing protein [Rhodospirillaceae bacterium]